MNIKPLEYYKHLNKMRKNINIRTTSGFTIIEMMIGIVLALISMVLVAQIMSSVTNQRKTTNSGNDAESAGTVASYLIERDLRQAGYGFNISPFIGCTTTAYDGASNGGAGRTFTISNTLIPVVISAGANAAIADSLFIRYSANDGGHSATQITSDYVSGASNLAVTNRFGVHASDLFIIGNETTPCSIYQASNILGVDNIETQAARFNKTGGLGNDYITGSSIISLGNLMVDRQYSINNAKLMVWDAFNPSNQTSPTTGDVLADSVVFFKAFYMKDANGDGQIDTIDQVVPNATTWNTVLGVKFALVTRTKTRDPSVLTQTPLILWDAQTFGTFNAPALSIDLTADMQQFRYKVFTGTIPLRNRIWSGS